MKINKNNTITATTKEFKAITNFLNLLENMDEKIWLELNCSTNGRFADALNVIDKIYTMIEVEDD